jgi:hypothetical protein
VSTLDHLNNKGSLQPDDVDKYNRLVKLATPEISEDVTKLINHAVEEKTKGTLETLQNLQTEVNFLQQSIITSDAQDLCCKKTIQSDQGTEIDSYIIGRRESTMGE